MKHMTKVESQKVGKLAKQLSAMLVNLSKKYYDKDSWRPDADFYAKDYEDLLALKGEMSWWLE
jgi:hypothetical protein